MPIATLLARGIKCGGIFSVVLIWPCAMVPAIQGGSGIFQLWQFVGVLGPWVVRRSIGRAIAEACADVNATS